MTDLLDLSHLTDEEREWLQYGSKPIEGISAYDAIDARLSLRNIVPVLCRRLDEARAEALMLRDTCEPPELVEMQLDGVRAERDAARRERDEAIGSYHRLESEHVERARLLDEAIEALRALYDLRTIVGGPWPEDAATIRATAARVLFAHDVKTTTQREK